MNRRSILITRILASIVVISSLWAILAHVFSTENRAERAATRLADAICDFRAQHARWPRELAELPDGVRVTFGDVKMQYDPQELTVTVPVSIVDRDHLSNLWSILRGSFAFSSTETTSISIYISARYTDRRPALIEKALSEGVPLNIDELEETEQDL